MKILIKNVFRKFGIEIKKYQPDIQNDINKHISLKSGNGFLGNVLLSYLNAPFLLAEGEPIPNTHTNYWESWQIAHTFLNLGYDVDIIHFKNSTFIPEKEYSIFIDVRSNLERLAPLLNKNCIKIMHIDHAHILFHNYAECRRLLDLQQRRGITLRPSRFEMPNLAIENADCGTCLGNEFTTNTYKYAGKPVYRIPISTTATYPWTEEKDFDSCRKNFLWFNSYGMVHKGLDLVLEAFAAMPEYHLMICGPVEKETHFLKAYYKELYETPNIHTIGWVDIASPKFVEIINNCIGLISASCSEGQSGSVVTCLHAGLIPIASYESGVDIDEDFGIILKSCSIDEIQDSIRRIGNLPAEELKHMSRRTWEFARANHTREKFSEEYLKTMETILTRRVHK